MSFERSSAAFKNANRAEVYGTDTQNTEASQQETKESLLATLAVIEESQKIPGSHPEYSKLSTAELDREVSAIEDKIHEIETYGRLGMTPKEKIAVLEAQIDTIEQAESQPYQGGVAKVIENGETTFSIHEKREQQVAQLEQEIHELEALLNGHSEAVPTPSSEPGSPAVSTPENATVFSVQETVVQTGQPETSPDLTEMMAGGAEQEREAEEYVAEKDPHVLHIDEEPVSLEQTLKEKHSATLENPTPYTPTPVETSGPETNIPTIESAHTFEELYTALYDTYGQKMEDSAIVAQIEKVRDGQLSIETVPEAQGIREKVHALLETDPSNKGLKMRTAQMGVEEFKQSHQASESKKGFFGFIRNIFGRR